MSIWRYGALSKNQYHDDSMQDELRTLRLSHVLPVAVSCNTSTTSRPTYSHLVMSRGW